MHQKIWEGIIMKMLILILKKVSILENIIENLGKCGISRGTILDGNGMAGYLAQMDDMPFFSALKMAFLEDSGDECKIILLVLNDDELALAKESIKATIGNIDAPNSGIMFTVPVLDVEGLGAK